MCRHHLPLENRQKERAVRSEELAHSEHRQRHLRKHRARSEQIMLEMGCDDEMDCAQRIDGAVEKKIGDVPQLWKQLVRTLPSHTYKLRMRIIVYVRICAHACNVSAHANIFTHVFE